MNKKLVAIFLGVSLFSTVAIGGYKARFTPKAFSQTRREINRAHNDINRCKRECDDGKEWPSSLTEAIRQCKAACY